MNAEREARRAAIRAQILADQQTNAKRDEAALKAEAQLTILSRHGWDQTGAKGKLLRFRHAGTGDEVEIAAGEIPFWVAQFVQAPQADDDWYASQFCLGAWHVRSKTDRRVTGLTHTRRGEGLFFFGSEAQAAAERVVLGLNLKDRQLTQARFF